MPCDGVYNQYASVSTSQSLTMATASASTVLPFLLAAGAFLVGSIPFGFIAGKMRGVDLREAGSGNIGATNTERVLGKRAGYTVLALDVIKGLLPVLAARSLFGLSSSWVVAIGLCAVLGHIYSPFVRFRGGKGVATSIGVLFGLSPLVAAVTVIVFVAAVALTRYVSVGSIAGAVTQAILFWVVMRGPMAEVLPYRLFGLFVGFFVIVRHRANIQRLMRGEENRYGKKAAPDTLKKPATPSP
jgi:glycerol-3-phosphate acyltransferase PlsY